MTLSIIIVNYNVQHYLQLCLDSVFAAIQHIDAEVIVVDNASADDSVTMVKTLFSKVKLIANDQNVGFSKANNIGVAAATGEYVCILNPDTVVGETVFEEVYAFAKAQPKHGISSVQFIDGTGHFLPESKRNLPTPKVSLQKLLGNGSGYYANHLQKDENGEVTVLAGAFMFIKRSVYEEAGGFDERYFMYGEDIDLSYTIKQAGYTNHYIGKTSIIHFKGESTVKDETYRKRFYGAMQLFYKKHLRKNIFESLFVNMGLYVAKIRSSIKNKNIVPVTTDFKNKPCVLISHSTQVEELVAKSVSSNVIMQSKMKLLDYEAVYIFDAGYCLYNDIIKEIITYRDAGAVFKIIPKNGTFAVGSNSSEGRGKIIDFKS